RILWPVYIVTGQALLLFLAWGFFGSVRAKGQIILPGHTADALKFSVVPLNLVVNRLYSLFSQAVRHAIVVALTRPLAISQLGFGILISRRSLILKWDKLKWLFASVILFVGTLTQTARGKLDIASDADKHQHPNPAERDGDRSLQSSINDSFTQLWTTRLQYYSIEFNYSTQPALILFTVNSSLLSIIEESGAASATSRAGYPTVIDFGGWAHTVSTGAHSSHLSENESWHTSHRDLGHRCQRDNIRYVRPAIQLRDNPARTRANVSCDFRTLDETTQPPLFRFTQDATATVAEEPYDFRVKSLATNCSGGLVLSDYTGLSPSNTNDTVFALGCGDVDDLSAKTYSTHLFKHLLHPLMVWLEAVIIEGQGASYAYMQTVVCTISPQIQNMISNYSTGFITSKRVFAVLEAFTYGQNMDRNTVGDSISAIFTDQPDPRLESPLIFLELLEAYITGIIEFVGTVGTLGSAAF
ncbi:hypothetical protein B0H17DRAFT_1154034, partial [Mycena rosella]